MFLDEQRLPIIRRMILASTAEQETEALQELRGQHKDFIELLEEMDGLPVTVRLLDPPLHEFLPQTKNLEDAARQALDQEQQDL